MTRELTRRAEQSPKDGRRNESKGTTTAARHTASRSALPPPPPDAATASRAALPDAAAMAAPHVTVFSPLAQHVTPGAEVAILGAGGLGHLAVAFADKMGATVTAVDTQLDKAKECAQLGAARALSADDFFAGAATFHLVLNCATTMVDGTKLAAALKPGGVAVQLGIPGAGLNMAIPVLETAFFELKFVGSNTGGRAVTTQCLEFAAKKGIKPRVEAMPMRDVNKAIERINAGEAHYRIVLVNE